MKAGFGNITCGFAIFCQNRDHCANSDILGTSINQNFGHNPIINRLNFHCCLIGFDFGNHIARTHVIAISNKPFCKRAFFHGWRQSWHFNFNGHDYTFATSLLSVSGNRISVNSSDGSGSGLVWANSVALVTVALTSESISFSRASSTCWFFKRSNSKRY